MFVKIVIKTALIVVFGLYLIPLSPIYAAVTSVTLTPLDPPTTMSDGRAYYLAGKSYRFRVQAVDAAATGKVYWDYIDLSFNAGTAAVRVSVGPDTVASSTGLGNAVITDNTIIYDNLDYTIQVRFLWNCAALPSVAHNIVATVREDGGSSAIDTRSIVYGIASDIRVHNLAQNGVAADGYVNPYQGFTVTGTIVYDLPGSTSTVADTVNGAGHADLGVAEITSLSLLQNAGASGCAIAGDESGFTYTVPASHFGVLGDYLWTVQCVMATAGGPKTSVNNLLLNVNRVRIDNVQFYNGGGVGSMAAPYYRSAVLAGTRVRITASLEDNSPSLLGNTSMRGNTNFELQFGAADAANAGYSNVTVPILSGATTGDLALTLPTLGEAPNLATTALIYRVRQVHNGALDDQSELAGGTVVHTPLAAARTINWDRNDPPDFNFGHAAGVYQTPFTTFGVTNTSAGSINFSWTTFVCPDFYSYKLYYRLTGAPTYTVIDRSTPGYTATLNQVTTTSTSINGLIPLTNYDYMVSAIDVFGNEVLLANRLSGTIPTQSASISLTLTDGVDVYPNLTTGVPVFRRSAIKVSFYIVTAGTIPDSVNLLLFDSLVIPPFINTSTGLPYFVPAYTATCTKTAPNTYVCFIPTTNSQISPGANSVFVCQTVYGGVPVCSGYNTLVDPNSCPWAFSISTTNPTFTPWPTRILNNVITKRDPVAYPAYYLTADANVSIVVYDILGRLVKTLLDNAPRRAGQNIKENGWDGTNKAGYKCGPGLYYVHIKAKRSSDGKVILDDFKKVVIAR